MVNSCQTKKETIPNFIIFFADDLGYGDLGCYGHPVIVTPNLDRLASEGLRLTSFYCGASVCSPSRAALLTGRYPIHAGMPYNTGPGSQLHLPEDQLLIPEILKQAGYRTMAIGKWHLGHQSDKLMPTGRGFDHFFGLPYSNDMIRPWVQTDEPLRLFRDTCPEGDTVDQRFLTDLYTEEAIKFITSDPGQPFFLYLAYSMPHLPVSTSDEHTGKSRAGLYGDVIQTIDWSVGQVLSTLEELGIGENTLVIFTSDNGPWHNLPDRMLQRGNERWHTGSKGLLRGSKGTTYEGGFRVPCIMRWPSMIPAGQVSSEMASTIDFFPTISKAVGVNIPEGYVLDGYDLTPFLMGTSPSPRIEFIYSQGTWFEALREGSWKYRNGQRSDEEELYHLDRDPSEMYNVIERYPETAQRLKEKLRAYAENYRADFKNE
jgi:arylsulfatase A-like enzyme